jgi:hypothetical protein
MMALDERARKASAKKSSYKRPNVFTDLHYRFNARKQMHKEFHTLGFRFFGTPGCETLMAKAISA